jgi:hypothetical protein
MDPNGMSGEISGGVLSYREVRSKAKQSNVLGHG